MAIETIVVHYGGFLIYENSIVEIRIFFFVIIVTWKYTHEFSMYIFDLHYMHEGKSNGNVAFARKRSSIVFLCHETLWTENNSSFYTYTFLFEISSSWALEYWSSISQFKNGHWGNRYKWIPKREFKRKFYFYYKINISTWTEYC